MFSVIIQNQKTMDSFNKCYPLFLESVNKNKVGVCRWVEAGTTVDTAVPELSAMTNDKPEWRAIIVHMYDEASMLSYPSNPQNPFDFEVNSQNGSWEETKVPLVRLTQLIGGVPAPQQNFTEKLITENGKAPRIVYEPQKDEQQDALYKKIAEKYHYHGKHPSEIILISIRTKNYEIKDEIESIWKSRTEIESSEFWKSNKYPSSCRFLFYEMDQQGPVVAAADVFKFWAAVMLLSTNKLDPSSLQAYRLYKLDIQVKPAEIGSSFQETLQRLAYAREHLEERIDEDDIKLLPRYSIDVPVHIETSHRVKNEIEQKSFGLVNKGSDMGKWNATKSHVDERTKKEIKQAEIGLDKTADRVRDFLVFAESGSFKVDKFQTKDIEEDLESAYNDVIRIQSELPKESLSHEEELKKLDKTVRARICERVSKFQALGGYVIITGIALIMAAPSVYFYSRHDLGTFFGIVILAIACLALPAIIKLAVLLYHKIRLRNSIQAYKNKHKSLIIKLHENISLYSDYMSNIATHARGSSFLRTVRKQKTLQESSYTVKQKHIRDINIFIANIQAWQTAFYCRADATFEMESSIHIDTEIPSKRNHFYTFDYDKIYPVEFNNSGNMLVSPVSFLDRLIIVREEIYDDSSSFN